MLLTYQECLDRYGSDYQLKKEIRNGNLFRKEKGIYSTARNTSEIDIIMRKYPKAVCTSKSAFFYHSLTDVIPDHYYLATRRSDTRIKDPRVVQSFLKDDLSEAYGVKYILRVIDVFSSKAIIYKHKKRIKKDCNCQ